MQKILISTLIIVLFGAVQGTDVRAKAKKVYVIKGTILMETFRDTAFLLDTGKSENAVSRVYSATSWI